MFDLMVNMEMKFDHLVKALFDVIIVMVKAVARLRRSATITNYYYGCNVSNV